MFCLRNGRFLQHSCSHAYLWQVWLICLLVLNFVTSFSVTAGEMKMCDTESRQDSCVAVKSVGGYATASVTCCIRRDDRQIISGL